ncbi:Protein SanA [Tenacibaculum litopenaei]|uniref:SanA/YdcF family protein n=1 Tax=Tenacibaculum litopenaei TaxID=396016 RepID=UPI0038967A42
MLLRKKLLWKSILAVLLLGTLFIFGCNWLVKKNATGKMYDSVTEVPARKVGLLLGTVKYLKNGQVNLYYSYRLEAAVALFKAGKISYILVSGDNGSKRYDEPTAFKEDLVKRGVPESRIVLDYAGFRTLDSVVRAKEVFGQDELIVISQKFHNERALYLAENKGIAAVAFNAKGVSGRYGLKVTVREYFARVKLFLDILFGVGPKFLGPKVTI